MTQVIQPITIKKNDLIKDYINFALVIVLSFFFKYSPLELAESIWFYSFIITYLIIGFQFTIYVCYKPRKYRSSDYQTSMSELLQFGLFAFMGYMVLLELIYMINNKLSLEFTTNYIIKNFLYYILFLPFIIYYHKESFKINLPKNSQETDEMIKPIGKKIFLLFWKLVLILGLIFIIGMYLSFIFQTKNDRILFIITYTLFFFPFTKTYKFLKQQKEIK